MEEDNDAEIVMRESDLVELILVARLEERARCQRIVIEESGSLASTIAGELCGIICAEIAEDD